MSQIAVQNNINLVDIDTKNNQILVTDPTLPTTITIDKTIIEVIEILTPGPQGPPGDPSILTSSFVNIDVYNEFTSSYNTGSFTGLFIGDGSGLTGINTSKWTGSLDGSISRESDVAITGSLFLNFDGIEDYFSIKVAGEEKLKINQQGILQLVSQSITPDPVPGGIFYSGSNEFYLGFEI
jgi:hypothetical protein